MAAADHLAPRQLSMFMTGTELKEHITESTDRGSQWPAPGNETLAEMWTRKTSDAAQPAGATVPFRDGRTGEVTQDPVEGAGLKDSIRARGYTGPPIQLSHHNLDDGTPLRMIMDGHTRIAAADDLERTEGKATWFPVQHGTGER